MSKRRTVALVLAGTLVLSGAAFADVIVDTGTPPDDNSGWTIGFGYGHAGEITLGQAWNITDIEIYVFVVDPGDVSLLIYGDNGGIPDTAALFYSTTFFSGDDNDGAWVGASGLDWDLEAGTYWVGFAPIGDVWAAAPGNAPDPLNNYAYQFEGEWDTARLDWGLRVEGTPVDSVVPEPATLTLCALGLAGLAGRAYRRRKAK